MKAPEQMSPDEFESMRGKVIKLYDESAMPPKSEGQKKAEFKVQMLEGELKKARTLEGGQARGVRRSRGAVKTEADLQAELDAAKKVVADEKDAWGKEQARKEEILWDEVQKSAPEAVSSGLVYREMLDGKLRVMNRVGLPSSGKDLIRSAIRDSKPVSAAAVEAYGIKLPSGYVKQGELFVFQPETPSQPAQAPAVQAAAQAGVVEARSEDGAVKRQEAGGEVAKKPRTYLNVPFSSKESAKTLELVNPRGVAGISVDEHPTTFDIPEPRKNVLTDASTPVTGGDGETTIRNNQVRGRKRCCQTSDSDIVKGRQF